jgi:hypothetical protein
MVADYSQGGTVEHIKTADNATTVMIDPADYSEVEDSGKLYVRIRNSNTSLGWGGTVSRIIIRYKVKANLTQGESGEWLKGTNPTKKVNDNAITTPSDIPETNEKDFLVKTENGVSTYRRKVITNNTNADMEFIFTNTSEANAEYRYCDLSRELVYCFDVSEMLKCDLTFRVLQNYIVEVSNNNKHWEEVANYYDISGGKHNENGNNDTDVDIDPFDYDCDETGKCYVRIRNCNTSTGWGGTVRYFVMKYTKNAQ